MRHDARLFKPARTAMQSGTAKTDRWVLVMDGAPPLSRDATMGWTTTSQTRQQVSLTFPSLEKALEYAKTNELAVTVAPEHPRRIQPKRYSDNFRHEKPRG